VLAIQRHYGFAWADTHLGQALSQFDESIMDGSQSLFLARVHGLDKSLGGCLVCFRVTVGLTLAPGMFGYQTSCGAADTVLLFEPLSLFLIPVRSSLLQQLAPIGKRLTGGLWQVLDNAPGMFHGWMDTVFDGL
jgi:hypothetical protein